MLCFNFLNLFFFELGDPALDPFIPPYLPELDTEPLDIVITIPEEPTDEPEVAGYDTSTESLQAPETTDPLLTTEEPQ